MVVFPAVPLFVDEWRTVEQIAKEIERLAKLVAALPQAKDGGAQAPPDAAAILRSVQKINTVLETGIGRGSLGAARLNTIGGEFSKIGAVLQRKAARPKTLAKAKPKTKRR